MLSGCLAALLVPAAFAIPDWRNRPVTAESHEEHQPLQSTGAKVHLTSAAADHEDVLACFLAQPATLTGTAFPNCPRRPPRRSAWDC